MAPSSAAPPPPVAPALASPQRPHSRTRTRTRTRTRLEPLALGKPGFIYSERAQSCIQYSLRAAGQTTHERERATERYETVKEQVTVLIAALCRSRATLQDLGHPVRLASCEGYYVECTCVRRGKATKAWEWTKDGQLVDTIDYKLRFEFGMA